MMQGIKTNKVTKNADGWLARLSQWLFEHQTALAFNTIVPLLLAHILVPTARPHTSKLFTLSYYNPDTGHYGAGYNDLYLVALFVVLCIGIRAALIQHLLCPLARSWGISNKKDISRFAEQGWMLIYYSVFWPLGMYLYRKSSYYLNLGELWTNWPQRELDGLTKVYILAQWAYWMQQLIVVNMEARRKDYWEMIAHHAITISLIAASYAYHQTRVGHLILVLMDVVELIFPLAKCLKYVGFTTICDVIFGVFLLTWFWTRHVFYLMVCWSVYSDLPRIIGTPACYRGSALHLQGPMPAPDSGWSHLLEPFQDPEGMVCFTNGIRTGFLVFLVALQLVICVWSHFIIRVSIRVLKGGSAEDVRSDDEIEKGELEEEEEEEEEEVQEHGAEPKCQGVDLVEEQVGVESIDFKSWERRSASKKVGGVRVTTTRSHSDRKELLNRIGCEKQIE